LLGKVEVRIAERVPVVYERKTYYLVKTDDAHRIGGQISNRPTTQFPLNDDKSVSQDQSGLS
jgi:hypothetical protein